MQSFHAYLGTHTSTGSFLFDHRNVRIFELMSKRFNQATTVLFGMSGFSRTNKRIMQIAKVIMVDRIWFEICMGRCEALGLYADAEFRKEDMSKVQPLLFMKCEDVIQAFAA